MPYLRPIPRLKPLGSAITSVFVSTFAMLSVAWTTFSVISGALVSSHDNTSDRNEAESTFEPGSHKERDPEEQTGLIREYDTGQATLLAQDKYEDTTDMISKRMNFAIGKSDILMDMRNSLSEMKLSLVRMRLALRQHGILQDDSKDDGAKVTQGDVDRPLLVHVSERSITDSPS
ncbi:hypothetical protein DFH06DRAFT_1185077 [Mycena polygramma]|nr:hypothetical protein DFH06DRAFT_1185077 [Mycena polygramma]